MTMATEQTPPTPRRTDPRPAPGGRDDGELDLDRLVWDPEYRAAMRPLLRHAG